MIVHREIADADPHALPAPHDQRIDRRKHLRVERPQVEVRHHRGIGPIGARVHGPAVQQEGEIALDRRVRGVARMDDEQPHHAGRQLHDLVGVRVVHVRAVLAQRELVGPGLAGLDVRLRQPADAVHPAGQQDAVPVDAGVLGQAVRHEDAHAVAFERLDRRTRRRAVVTPGLHPGAGRELVFDLLRDEVELLHAVDAAPGKRTPIERRDARSCGIAWRRSRGRRHRGGNERRGSGRGEQCATGQLHGRSSGFRVRGGSPVTGRRPPIARSRRICAWARFAIWSM